MMKQPIILLLFCFVSTPCFTQYNNLAMEGAGIRGLAYPGVIKVLEENEILRDINRIAGTSVGALVGALLSVGYSADELKEIMFSLKVQQFNDGRGIFIGGQKRLRKNFGWYRGEKLEQWIGTLIHRKTGNAELSFIELHALRQQHNIYKDLFVTATNLTQQKAETFSWISHPKMKIKTAVRISVSIPIYFTAVFLDDSGAVVKHPKPSGNYQVYVDGGILNNYPLSVFDTIPSPTNDISRNGNRTLGIKSERPEQLEWYKSSGMIAPFKINSFKQYISALYNIVIESLNRNQPYEQERVNTIYINTNNIPAKVSNINKAQKQLLYDTGVSAARDFFLYQN